LSGHVTDVVKVGIWIPVDPNRKLSQEQRFRRMFVSPSTYRKLARLKIIALFLRGNYCGVAISDLELGKRYSKNRFSGSGWVCHIEWQNIFRVHATSVDSKTS
jgi:hypothetical protein